jgi:hypothetical protein
MKEAERRKQNEGNREENIMMKTEREDEENRMKKQKEENRRKKQKEEIRRKKQKEENRRQKQKEEKKTNLRGLILQTAH